MVEAAAIRPRSFQNLGLSAAAGQPDKAVVIKIVITHTDLRLYWPARIAALQKRLQAAGSTLHVIEIAGCGSPYDFAGQPSATAVPSPTDHSSPTGPPSPTGQDLTWTRLFPHSRMEDIPPACACKRLMDALDEMEPDAVLAGSIAFPSGAAAVSWAKTRQRPVIIFDDVRNRQVPRNPVVNLIKRTIYGQVDAILCPAAPWVEDFEQWGFRREQIFFGVDVVDNDFWRNRQPASTALAHHLPGKFLLAVGRLIPAKNFTSLLEAYRRYLSSIPDDRMLPLVIVGDGPERERLETFIALHGMNRQVRLLSFQQPDLLRDIYRQATALVLPSLSETWGLVVNEAMAAGKPVIVSSNCGCASVLVNEAVNGYCFSPDNPEQLSGILENFSWLGPDRLRAMGFASKSIIMDWGLDRFAGGSLDAIEYARAHYRPCKSPAARWLIRHWKGRYRPV